MTNAMIILGESIRLMEAGVLNGTGEIITFKFDDGTTKDVEMPEPIHTYQTWKKLGYQVRKGEKAIAKFMIWKHTSKEVEDNNGEMATESHMFMKSAAFFKMSQLERIKEVKT